MNRLLATLTSLTYHSSLSPSLCRRVSPADLKELFSDLPDVMVSLGNNEADRTFIYEDRVNAPMLKAHPDAAGPPRFR